MIVYMNPRHIIWESKRFNNHERSNTPVEYVDGGWDKKRWKYMSQRKFISKTLTQFDTNVKLTETDYYKAFMEKLSTTGLSIRELTNEEQIIERCEVFRDMYFDIKNNGWRDSGNYVTINIGHDGTVLFNSCQHRIRIARHLNIRIPMQIAVIHKLLVSP
jgi:hypothetical protein